MEIGSFTKRFIFCELEQRSGIRQWIISSCFPFGSQQKQLLMLIGISGTELFNIWLDVNAHQTFFFFFFFANDCTPKLNFNLEMVEAV